MSSISEGWTHKCRRALQSYAHPVREHTMHLGVIWTFSCLQQPSDFRNRNVHWMNEGTSTKNVIVFLIASGLEITSRASLLPTAGAGVCSHCKSSCDVIGPMSGWWKQVCKWAPN